jgi:hypothetical protein
MWFIEPRRRSDRAVSVVARLQAGLFRVRFLVHQRKKENPWPMDTFNLPEGGYIHKHRWKIVSVHAMKT